MLVIQPSHCVHIGWGGGWLSLLRSRGIKVQPSLSEVDVEYQLVF